MQIQQPQNIGIRPLTKGMVLNISSLHAPAESCRLAANYIVDERGLRRRPSLETYNKLEGLDSPLIDMATLWTAAGTQNQFLFSQKYLYSLPNLDNADVSPQRIEWTFDEGTVEISGGGATVEHDTGDGVWETPTIQEGDIIEINDEARTITDINRLDSRITVDEAFTHTEGTGYSYKIVRTFDRDHIPDWEIIDEQLVITDYKHPPMVFDPTEVAFEEFVTDYPGGYWFRAESVIAFNGRAWFGSIDQPQGDGLKRQRIVWSILGNPRDFSLDTAFIDLQRLSGSIIRMIPLNESLVAYANDRIFFGTPTNNPELPLAFDEVDTAQRGVVGKRAVHPWVDGHFWVGLDDIFFFSNRGNERIGSTVVRDTIMECEHPEFIYVAPDFDNERMLFGFPEGEKRIEKIWSYAYKVQAWSYDAISAQMIATPLPNFGLSWSDLFPFDWDAEDPVGDQFEQWRLMQTDEQRRKTFIGSDDALKTYTLTGSRDEGEDGQIKAEFITNDYDFDEPDQLKHWIRLGVKVGFNRSLGGNLNFEVQVSNNRGRSYKRVGILRIRKGMDEGYVTFNFKGSHLRARLVSTSEVHPYWIEEIVWRVRLAGRERTAKTQTGFSG